VLLQLRVAERLVAHELEVANLSVAGVTLDVLCTGRRGKGTQQSENKTDQRGGMNPREQISHHPPCACGPAHESGSVTFTR
jgi:hypothetical protein